MKRIALLLLLVVFAAGSVLGEVVEIPDPNLRVALEKALGKNEGEVITKKDLLKLTKLKAAKSNISDLSGLQFCINLTQLALYYNGEITDISVLSNLTNLVNLDLGGNKIKDISPLSQLKQIISIGLHYNQIEDITSLGKLLELR